MSDRDTARNLAVRPPLISVVVPVYDAEAWLAEAVGSALAAHADLEVVLVEDGSSDGSLAICSRLAAEQERVFLYRHPGGRNRGVGASRNLGIRRSRGEYIAFLDADDYYLPNRFEVDVPLMAANREIDGVHNAVATDVAEGGYALHDHDLIVMSAGVKPGDLFSALLRGHRGWFHVDGITVRARVFDRVGFFNERIWSEDWEMFIRMAAVCRLEAGSLHEPVAVRRWHRGNRARAETGEPIDNARWVEAGCERTSSALRWARRAGLPAGKLRELREHLVVAVVHRRVAGRGPAGRAFHVARRALRYGLGHPWLPLFVAAEVGREGFRRLRRNRGTEV